MGKKIEIAKQSVLSRLSEALNKSLAHNGANDYDNGYAQGIADALEIISKHQ